MHYKPLRMKTILVVTLIAGAMNLLSCSSGPQGPAPMGRDAKIRLGWTQWHHWTDKSAPKAGTDLLDGLANVGVNVFADWGPNEKMGLHARKLGIRYYGIGATASLRGPAQAAKNRLADWR